MAENNGANETKMKLTKFQVEEIGGKEVVDGITYALYLTGKDDTKIQAAQEIIRELGDNAQNTMQAYQFSNGCVFDLNINVAKQISAFIIESSVKSGHLDPTKVSTSDLVGNGPDTRRREDIERLAKYLKKVYTTGRPGQKAVDVVLYSRNKVGTASFNAKDTKGNNTIVTYQAFAIRHWDLNTLNQMFLANENFKVINAQAGEIIPSKNGVRFRLTIG